jgi:hypothetical protein
VGRELTQFKPGWAGGPGRPKGVSLKGLLKQALEKETLGDQPCPNGRNVAETFVEAVLIHAIGGNPSYMKEIWERVEGKVKDKVEHDGEIKIRVEYADDTIATPSPSSNGSANGSEAV